MSLLQLDEVAATSSEAPSEGFTSRFFDSDWWRNRNLQLSNDEHMNSDSEPLLGLSLKGTKIALVHPRLHISCC